jgi:hypothetical protein
MQRAALRHDAPQLAPSIPRTADFASALRQAAELTAMLHGSTVSSAGSLAELTIVSSAVP